MLDRDGPVPIYVQIADVIHEQITSGRLRAGEAVPSETALEAEFGVARSTARNVVRELRARRLVHTVQGEGTFVGPAGVPRIRRAKALYLDIAQDVAERIRRGELRPNRLISSETALMVRHGVAKVTVRKAVAYLRKQGWVFTAPGGTYVNEPEKWPSE
ncbi:GntR family transcriptional regulator [Nonomuraea phyllanthi]|uniref:GntR family transcriptional regulator n=1 Tax=Nonomuraea phyllanthi TaxID=2219224 RepID=A0A5C4V7L4_9ACTN|nr:winged helix-turn-helix domain-containing protein [Nonomuraea phyllanthi]KAB8187485.1 GntR family transcriptional regulator [Nonomuraea phyllanthi]QFY07085.1 GntR family transcriptional regulator [Nonomuraea phyllanthi]